MGNNLCATWQRGYRERTDWPAKDPHLIRLWAEIFKVKEENNQFIWSRISEDVVPVNVFCIKNMPEMVLQIVAYNRLVEKIFDVFITQPGTQFIQSSERFVHWRDEKSGHAWGLNFTNSGDARAFQNCCMVQIPSFLGIGKTVKPDSSQTYKRSQAENVASFYGHGKTPIVGHVSGSASENANGRQSDLLTNDPHCHYSSPKNHSPLAKPQNTNCCPQVAQPYQMRQIVSVYLDNRCQCGMRRASFDRLSDPTGSRSLPYNISVADRARLYQLEHHRGDGGLYGTTNMAMFKQEAVCSKHCRPVRTAQMEAVDYDNSVNQTICQRMAMKARDPGKKPLALDWKNPDRSDKSAEVGGKKHCCCCRTVPHEMHKCSDITAANNQTECPDIGENQGKQNAMNKSRDYDLRELERSNAPPIPVVFHSLPLQTDSLETELVESNLSANARISSHKTEKEENKKPTHSKSRETEKIHNVPTKPSFGPKGAEKNLVAHVATDAASNNCQTLQTGHILPEEMSASVMHSSGEKGILLDAAKSKDRTFFDGQQIDAISDDPLPNRQSSDVDLENVIASDKKDGFESLQNSFSNMIARKNSICFQEIKEVRQMMTSDVSGSEVGSDLEDGWDCSSLHTMPSQASFASKSTVVRRLGWLTVKNWLVHRKYKIELAPKRTWKKYWVCLKGNILHFFVNDESARLSDGATPRHKLVIESALVQPAPEHPKKENAFSLSTAFGDAYLFQASSQSDLDNWVRSIHSACAASLARQHGKMDTLRLLSNEVHRLDTAIDMDIKMRKMALMHLTSVTDSRSRQAIEKQINQWEKNLEKLYIDHYRLKCYIASLQGTELPNPKSLLGSVSKNTKVFLSRIGVFTVSAFHAFVCARSFSAGTGSSFMMQANANHQKLGNPNQPIGPRTQSFKLFSLPPNSQKSRRQSDIERDRSSMLLPLKQMSNSLVRVKLPNSQTETSIQVTPDSTVQDVIEAACGKNRLNTKDYFLQLTSPSENSAKVPERNSQLCSEEYESIELRPKLIHQVELVRTEDDFGFEVEAELAEDADQEDELCLFISAVTVDGIAAANGLIVGDEILVINGRVVSELDMVFIENLLLECRTISLTLRSCQSDLNQPFSNRKITHSCDIENLMCPPPPAQMAITDENIGNLIVPAPNLDNHKEIPDLLRMRIRKTENGVAAEQIDDLLKGVNQVMHLCHRQYSLRSANLPDNGNSAPASLPQPMSNAQRICKVVLELVETERSYVRDLTCLIERYLEPLKDETYISSDDVEQLFGNIQQIVQFQRLFLHCLEDAICSDPNFNNYNDNRLNDENLGRVLLQIGNSFLYYAHHFKLYSSFCASHSKAQKMILSDDNAELREFLLARNPKQQHSSALESYLIKPIQRILKYPLLLKQLTELTDPCSDEFSLLKDALGAMESIAEHINEMQKIYEEYGVEFEELMKLERQERPSYKHINLNVGELQMYGSVNWVNFTDELGKPKKGHDPLTLIFIFKSAIVIMTQEQLRARKRSKAFGGSSDPVRYKIAIPVSEVQVRSVIGDPSDCRGLWEMIHCRSEKEGRPKKTFQFLSSLKARNDFIRTIHRTVHEKCESARRVSVCNHAAGHPVLTLQGTNYHHPNQICHSSEAELRQKDITAKDLVTSRDNQQNSPRMRTSSTGIYGPVTQPSSRYPSGDQRIYGGRRKTMNQCVHQSRSNTTSPLCHYDNTSPVSSSNRNRTNSYSYLYESDAKTLIT